MRGPILLTTIGISFILITGIDSEPVSESKVVHNLLQEKRNLNALIEEKRVKDDEDEDTEGDEYQKEAPPQSAYWWTQDQKIKRREIGQELRRVKRDKPGVIKADEDRTIEDHDQKKAPQVSQRGFLWSDIEKRKRREIGHELRRVKRDKPGVINADEDRSIEDDDQKKAPPQGRGYLWTEGEKRKRRGIRQELMQVMWDQLLIDKENIEPPRENANHKKKQGGKKRRASPWVNEDDASDRSETQKTGKKRRSIPWVDKDSASDESETQKEEEMAIPRRGGKKRRVSPWINEDGASDRIETQKDEEVATPDDKRGMEDRKEPHHGSLWMVHQMKVNTQKDEEMTTSDDKKRNGRQKRGVPFVDGASDRSETQKEEEMAVPDHTRRDGRRKRATPWVNKDDATDTSETQKDEEMAVPDHTRRDGRRKRATPWVNKDDATDTSETQKDEEMATPDDKKRNGRWKRSIPWVDGASDESETQKEEQTSKSKPSGRGTHVADGRKRRFSP